MKFAHFADIHIRNTVRHEEYLKVFEKVYALLRKEKPDRIAVSGDLLHSKTILSPESVIIARQFLGSLSEIAPVDVVLGNHDLNMSNVDREDAISAILSSVGKTSHAIYFYRESGIYHIDDKFAYGVFSVLDEETPELYPPQPEGDKIGIALFHGKLDKSRSSLDLVLDSDISMSIFDGYSFGFLGDIHRPQGFDEKIHVVEEEIDESLLEEYRKKYPHLEVL